MQESMGSPYGFKIEAQFEKQNRVLTQILGMVAKQKEIEEQREQRQKYDMRDKIQELEYDKMKADLELEKQKSRSQIGIGTPKKSSPKKDPSNLEKVVLGLVLKKAASKVRIEDEKEEETMDRSLPPIKEKSYQELGTPKRPRISVRRKRIVSPGGTVYKEMTASPLLPKSMKSLNGFEEEGSFNGGTNKSMVIPASLSRFKSTKESAVAKSQVITESSSKSIVLEAEAEGGEGEKVIVERSKRKRRTRKEKTRKEEAPVVLESVGRKEGKKSAKKYGKLVCFGWALVFGRVLFSERKKRKMEEKAKFEEEISWKVGQIYEVIEVLGRELIEIL